jgi:microcystin-dependent protein
VSQPYIGEIRMFAGDFAPVGWALCQGQSLPIEDHVAAFEVFGTTYGGDGMRTFNVPDLRGRVPIHRGPGYEIGQSGDAPLNAPPPAGVNHIIALEGDFPGPDSELEPPSPFIAEIRVFGFGYAPEGWAACDGRVIPMTENGALESLLSNTYGGDRQSMTFALPNLAGTAPLMFCIAVEGVYPRRPD